MQAQHEAFLAFMQPYARIIKHTIWRVCGDKYPALQADIEQEVYLTLWAQWTEARHIDSPISYLYKVALRAALAMLRSYSAAELADDVESGSATRQDQPENDALTTERAMVLSEFLDQLSVEQARAVRAHLAGFTQQEIAHLYGWSVSVARHRIYRGLQALRAFAMQEVG
jgi:RNA polymerase sigma factor (sigma-70 family)